MSRRNFRHAATLVQAIAILAKFTNTEAARVTLKRVARELIIKKVH